MRGAFLACLGDVERAGHVVGAAERHGLGAIDLSPGRLVFASSEVPVTRAGNGEILLGDCFSHPAADAAASVRWGNFVAFSAPGQSARVERAPLTGMPLYWSPLPAGFVCGSDPCMVQALVGTPSIDWEYAAQSLVYINHRTGRTGFSGLSELLPGTRVTLDGGTCSVTPTWLPWDFVEAPPATPIEMARELERCIIDCTAAWTATRGDILIELSGGLDSSIVAAALGASGSSFSAINFATPDAEGDERYYARAVADFCGIELTEVVHDDSAIDLVALPHDVAARPAAYSLLSGLDEAFETAVPDRLRPIFGGIGGDSVFQYDATVAPILDTFGRSGVSRRVWIAMRDVARASGATIWEAARLSWRAHRAGPRLGWRRDTSFLNEAAMPRSPLRHPWDDGGAGVSQAKRNHAESIRRIVDFLDRPGRWRDRDVVAPLLSQPIVEHCLSIPSDCWFAGGRDRAVARAAFADRLPPEVVWRRGKGRMEALCAAAYLRQRPQLRSLLLDGRLAEMGMLNRPAIEAYLARDLADGEFDYFRLIEIGDTERWVRAVESGQSFGASFDQR